MWTKKTLLFLLVLVVSAVKRKEEGEKNGKHRRQQFFFCNPDIYLCVCFCDAFVSFPPLCVVIWPFPAALFLLSFGLVFDSCGIPSLLSRPPSARLNVCVEVLFERLPQSTSERGDRRPTFGCMNGAIVNVWIRRRTSQCANNNVRKFTPQVVHQILSVFIHGAQQSMRK